MKYLLALPILLLASVSQAELIDAGPGGFTVKHEQFLAAKRTAVWQVAVGAVGKWWNDDHTVSGDGQRMRIDARPQGCFCEYLEGGNGVVHLTVTSVSRNVMLRMTGGLGPLGLMGVTGNMTWELFEENSGTRVRFTYAVGGYAPDGLEEIAVAVDYVVGEALSRLKAHVENSGSSGP